MALLRAPAQKKFTRAPQGSHPATVTGIEVQDHTVKPDQFGNLGGYTFVFQWQLEDVVDEDDNPITVREFVPFLTGDWVAKKGNRAGRIPALTEITRAFGELDIEPKAIVDTDRWLGKRALLGILLEPQAEGEARNRVNSHDPLKPSEAQAGNLGRVKTAPAPIDPNLDIPF